MGCFSFLRLFQEGGVFVSVASSPLMLVSKGECGTGVTVLKCVTE